MSSTLANHYICPDDLSPLPTTLDAKKSPLALLAQTCSNIGADLLPNNKPIIPPLEKPKKMLGTLDRCDSVSSQHKHGSIDNRSNSANSNVDVKISFKPYETSITPSHVGTINGSNGLSSLSSSLSISSSTPSSSLSTTSSTPSSTTALISAAAMLTGKMSAARKCDKSMIKDQCNSRSNSVDVINECNNKNIYNNNYNNSNNININNNNNIINNNNNNHHHHSHLHKKMAYHDQRNSSPSGVDCKSANSNGETIGLMRASPHSRSGLTAASTPSTTASLSSSSSSSSSSSGHPSELSPLIYSTSNTKNQLTSSSSSSSASKSDTSSLPSKSPSALISSMSGYNNYHNLNSSAVAAANAAALQSDLLKSSHFSSSLLPPYLNPAHAAAALNSLKANNGVCRDPFCKGCQLSSLTGLASNIPCANGCNGCMHSMHTPHPLSGSYLHPSLSSFSSSTASPNPLSSLRPFICNWTVGGSYCGKTFTSCEELLQHLKTHTNGASPFGPLGPYGFPSSLPHGLPSLPGNLRSQQSHPSLDSFRYHPYKLGPPGIPPSLAPGAGAAPAHLSSLTAPALSSLYPAYSMYNGRI